MDAETAMNERECAQAYEWVLKQLQRLRALDLIGDIEATVAAGLVSWPESGC